MIRYSPVMTLRYITFAVERLCFTSVCLLDARLLKQLRTDFDASFGRGGAWLENYRSTPGGSPRVGIVVLAEVCALRVLLV